MAVSGGCPTKRAKTKQNKTVHDLPSTPGTVFASATVVVTFWDFLSRAMFKTRSFASQPCYLVTKNKIKKSWLSLDARKTKPRQPKTKSFMTSRLALVQYFCVSYCVCHVLWHVVTSNMFFTFVRRKLPYKWKASATPKFNVRASSEQEMHTIPYSQTTQKPILRESFHAYLPKRSETLSRKSFQCGPFRSIGRA